jgi:hypothetical protein
MTWPRQHKPLVVQGTVWQGSDCVLAARIRSIDGQYLNQVSLTSVVLTVYNQLAKRAVLLGPLNLTISSVVFDTLQHNSVLWPIDAIGYNFLYRLAGAAAFPTWVSLGLANPTEGQTFVDVIFTLLDGTDFPAQWSLSTMPVP